LSFLLPDAIPPEYAEKAEEVRAYLVQLRGGAPFLSAADARILIQWFDEGISTTAILAALDQVSLKRRKKRVRSRLSLSICKSSLKKVTTNKKRPLTIQKSNSIHILAQKIADLNLSPELISVRNSLTKILFSIGSKSGDAEENEISSAISACLAFHSQAWELAESEHEELHRQAEKELAPLAALLPPIKWRESVEEIMRDTIRMRYPLISAKNIWDATNQT